MSEEKWPGWCFLELMGHRKLAGYVSEQEIAGSGFLRIDVYDGEATSPSATQFYAPSAVYAITPTTEKLARGFARMSQPQPVSRWELPPGETVTEITPEADSEEWGGF